jgi:hypothetical protein
MPSLSINATLWLAKGGDHFLPPPMGTPVTRGRGRRHRRRRAFGPTMRGISRLSTGREVHEAGDGLRSARWTPCGPSPLPRHRDAGNLKPGCRRQNFHRPYIVFTAYESTPSMSSRSARPTLPALGATAFAPPRVRWVAIEHGMTPVVARAREALVASADHARSSRRGAVIAVSRTPSTPEAADEDAARRRDSTDSRATQVTRLIDLSRFVRIHRSHVSTWISSSRSAVRRLAQAAVLKKGALIVASRPGVARLKAMTT